MSPRLMVSQHQRNGPIGKFCAKTVPDWGLQHHRDTGGGGAGGVGGGVCVCVGWFRTRDRDTGGGLFDSEPRTETQVVGLLIQDHGQRHRWRVGWFRTMDRGTGGGLVDSGPWTETQVGGFFQHNGQRQRRSAGSFSTTDRDLLRQEIASV